MRVPSVKALVDTNLCLNNTIEARLSPSAIDETGLYIWWWYDLVSNESLREFAERCSFRNFRVVAH